MNIWLKIETFINNVLSSLIAGFSRSFKKATPKNVLKSAKSINISIQQIKEKTSQIKSTQKKAVALKTTQLKAKTFEKAQLLKKTLRSQAQAAKSFDWSSLNSKKVFGLIGLLFLPLFSKINAWCLTIKPQMIVSFFAASAVVTISGITIFQQSKKIAEKSSSESEEPTIITDSVDANSVQYGRTKFRNYEMKKLTITSVSMPVYIKNQKKMQSLQIDFTIISSNRYIREFFQQTQKENILRDRLNSTIEPVIPTFPLENEGKIILKEKIKLEINNLIRELKINGEIKEIYIHSIISS